MNKFTSQISEKEVEMQELLTECEDLVEDNLLKTQDAKRILNAGYSLLNKCAELRRSRDNHKNKYNLLKEKYKEIKEFVK